MNKLLLAKQFQVSYVVPLEQTISLQKPVRQNSKIGKGSAKVKDQTVTETVQRKVGSITIDLNLQRGNTEEELQRQFQIKLLQQEEQRRKEEEERMRKEKDRLGRYMTEQEPVFAQLYMHIRGASEVEPRPLHYVQALQEKALAFDTFNQRNTVNQVLPEDSQQPVEIEPEKPVITPNRNLFVQYKAFPSLERLKTQVVYAEKEPRFKHQSQFPVMMVPDTLDKLEEFSFILEVWDEITPTQPPELVGLVKLPLKSFCISMKTTEEQVFSLNFLADQHCIYPMIISDQPLPIYSPREGRDIGMLNVTLSMGSPLQINRQIQKDREQEEKLEAEARRRKDQEIELNLERERRMAAEAELRARAEEAERLASQKGPVVIKERTPEKAPVGLSQEDLMNSLTGFFRKSVQKKDLDTSKNSFMDCVRKLFEEARSKRLPSLEAEIFEGARKTDNKFITRDEFIQTLIQQSSFPLTRSELGQVFSLFEEREREALNLKELENSYQQYLKYNEVIEKGIIEHLELFEICLRKAIRDRGHRPEDQLDEQTEWFALLQQIEDKVSESRILLADLKRVLEDNGVVVGPSILDKMSSLFDLERDDRLYFSSVLSFLSSQEKQSFNFFKVCPQVYVQHAQEIIKGCIQEVGIEKFEREISEALTKLHPEIDALLNSQVGPVPRIDLDKVESPSKKLGNSQRQRQSRKNQEKEQAELEAKIAEERARLEKEEQELRVKKLGGVLLKENVPFDIFQRLLEKSSGSVLSSWEIFCFFEMLNMTYAKMFYEPKRCREVAWPYVHKFVTNQDFKESLAQRVIMKSSVDSGLALALNLNEKDTLAPETNKSRKGDQKSPCGRHSKRKDKHEDSGIYSSKSHLSDASEEEEEEKEQTLRGSPKHQHSSNRHGQNAQPITEMGRDSFGVGGQPPRPEIKTTHYSPKKSTRREQEHFQNVEQPTMPHILQDNREYSHLKHIFEIKVTELKQIPVLNKIIREQAMNQDTRKLKTKTNSPRKKSEKRSAREGKQYIQNVAVQFAFPLDQDELLESDFLMLKQEGQFDYTVSMETVHSYTLSKKDNMGQVLTRHSESSNTQCFNLQLVAYDQGRKFVIGNAQLPVEDLIQLVESQPHFNESFPQINQMQKLERILMIYGTQYSERENCYIGKLNLQISYHAVRDFSQQPQPSESQLDISQTMFNQANQQCFMHRETFVNRKIPLNANVSVQIDKIQGLKEAVPLMEHSAKIYQLSDSAIEEGCPSVHFYRDNHIEAQSYSAHTGIKSKKEAVQAGIEATQKRRMAAQILKEGLNVAVFASVFEQDQGLKEKLGGSERTRLIYNTLHPVFNEGFDFNVQMDAKVFNYFQNKNAVFEVRHYIKKRPQKGELSSDLINQSKIDGSHAADRSLPTDDEEDEFLELHEHIVLGRVEFPLLSLITKNSGIDGDFQIIDEFKQVMGTLRLRMSLNHHNTDRPLYSQSNKVQGRELGFNERETVRGTMSKNMTLLDKAQTISNSVSLEARDSQSLQYALGLNFQELLLNERPNLEGADGVFYLTYKMLGQNHRTKFFVTDRAFRNAESADLENKLKFRTIKIGQVQFISLDLSDSEVSDKAFGKPLEIQLWFKQKSASSYQRAQKELNLGSFLVDLNELGKVTNYKVKSGSDELFANEGYFTLYNYDSGRITTDRLGLKVFLAKNIADDGGSFERYCQDLEVLFNNLNPLTAFVERSLDKNLRGTAELDELEKAVEQHLQGRYKDLFARLLQNMEFKNHDKVYYSPLFGELGPFFKYGRRFNQAGVVAKFYREFAEIDKEGDGLVELALFRSILERELSIKESIVDDFIFQCKPQGKGNKTYQLQSLDVNLTTDAKARNQIDYVVVVRKLLKFFDLNLEVNDQESVRRLSDSHIEEFAPVQTQLQASFRRRDEPIPEARAQVEIESAIRLRLPEDDMVTPNTFVELQWPFSEPAEEIRTEVIQHSQYPAWHFKKTGLKLILSKKNVAQLASLPLEFVVKHRSLVHDQMRETIVGYAPVDISSLLYVEGKKEVSGYFHIFRRDDLLGVRDSQTNTLQHSLAKTKSLGEVKISIALDVEIKRLAQQAQRDTVDRLSPLRNSLKQSSENPFAQQKYDHGDSFGKQNELQNTLSQYMERIGSQEDPSHLRQQLSANLSVLDQLTSKLKMSLGEGVPAILASPAFQQQEEARDEFERDAPEQAEENVFRADFTMTQGVKADLRSQLEPLHEELKERSVEQKVADKYSDPNQVVQEESESEPSPAKQSREASPAPEEPENVFAAAEQRMGEGKDQMDKAEYERYKNILQKKQ